MNRGGSIGDVMCFINSSSDSLEGSSSVSLRQGISIEDRLRSRLNNNSDCFVSSDSSGMSGVSGGELATEGHGLGTSVDASESVRSLVNDVGSKIETYTSYCFNSFLIVYPNEVSEALDIA